MDRDKWVDEINKWINDEIKTHSITNTVKVKNNKLFSGLDLFAFKYKNNIFLNGEREFIYDNIFEYLQSELQYSTLSLRCLCRFEFKGEPTPSKIVKLANKLIRDEIKIVDYTKDKTTYSETKPGPGYTKIDDYWHRPATFLIRFPKFTVLMGQDDGSYFGCQLPKHAKSIDHAFEILVPNEAKDNIGRQGEWFVVPVKEQPIIGNFNYYEADDAIVLPRESEQSNKHSIEGGKTLIDKKTGKIFTRSSELHHYDHVEVYIPDSWHTFVRNTAVRSFSEQGID